GWAWVGERGPELVRMRGGEQVIPSHVARGYAGGSGWDWRAIFNPSVGIFGRRLLKAANSIEASLTRIARQEAASGALPSGGSGQAAMRYAQSMLGLYGWTQAQWPALRALWMGESGWNKYATNPTSGAYGIPQALPAIKMA